MKKEGLRLFKSYLGDKKTEINNKALKYGLLIPNNADDEIVNYAIELYGKDGLKWNQTFHKDFEIVRNAPIEDLISQQMIHYMTTYGFESLGFYNSDLVYIPNEKLEIPDLDVNEKIGFITIKPITEDELSDKILSLITSGIALSKQTIEDIMVLSDYIDKNKFDDIKNKEIKIALYDKYNITPNNPEEFLRYLIFKITGETLKIQNKEMFNKLKRGDKKMILELLETYIKKVPNGKEKLSSIFLRNKNLFLSLKEKVGRDWSNTEYFQQLQINKIINKLRKLAIKNHKPLSKNILDVLTDKNYIFNYGYEEDIINELNKISVFREIRIINGLSYRLYGNDNILYKIRNGKSYVKTIDNKDAGYIKRINEIYNLVYNHLINRLKEKVNLKTIYIPDNINYAAPTSEKQFNNNIPEGSYIDIPRNSALVYGIHWNNLIEGSSENLNKFYGEYNDEEDIYEENRVDLDLKQMNKNEVFGWDAKYRSSNSDIYFSGDVTDAPLPNGATELFYVGENYGQGAFLVTVNNFTHNGKDVPFEFVIAEASHRSEIRKNHVIDPNKILCKINMTVPKDNIQMVAGFITIGDNIRFYFNDFTNGNNITSRKNDCNMKAFDYLNSYNKVQLKLKDILKDAGAIITNKPTITVTKLIDNSDEFERYTAIEEEIKVDFDLSLENIDKSTIINLLS